MSENHDEPRFLHLLRFLAHVPLVVLPLIGAAITSLLSGGEKWATICGFTIGGGAGGMFTHLLETRWGLQRKRDD